MDPAYILEQIELQIGKVNEESLIRKEILEEVEKWIAACEEECWLEEYNRDENRYIAGRGTHLTPKRAEKARALVNRLPGMVETLALKTSAWENESGIEFTYDGIRLLFMLVEYNILRQEKEQERKRQRDQKKLQGRLNVNSRTGSSIWIKTKPRETPECKKSPNLSCGCEQQKTFTWRSDVTNS